MRWASVFCAFTLVQLSVFGAVVEGNTIFDWSVHKGFRILSFNPFSTEDSVLITVKLWFRNHQAGVVFCTSVFYAYKLQTKQTETTTRSKLIRNISLLTAFDHPVLCCDRKKQLKTLSETQLKSLHHFHHSYKKLVWEVSNMVWWIQFWSHCSLNGLWLIKWS